MVRKFHISLFLLTVVLGTALSALGQVTGHVIHCGKISVIDGDSLRCDGVNMRPMGPGPSRRSGHAAFRGTDRHPGDYDCGQRCFRQL